MAKKDAIVETMYRRQILEILKGLNPEGIEKSEIDDSNIDKGLLRSEILTKLALENKDGRLHKPCNDMGSEGLVAQVFVSHKVGYRVYITAKGVGYLQSMKDYEIGIAAT